MDSLDFHFTERVFSTTVFNRKSGNLNEIIDVIQVFSMGNSKDDFLSVDILNQNGDLVFETRSETKIREMYNFINQRGDKNLNCEQNRDDTTMHALAHDRGRMKMAYFLAYRYISNQGKEVTVLIVPGRSFGLSVIYNQSFGPFISA